MESDRHEHAEPDRQAGRRHEQGTVETMEMPLFPLNVVLFPGMVLPLHIFEERYRDMIHYCIEQKSPFGVALIADGEEAGAPATPHLIGTAAHIRRVQKMPDGRLNIMTVGKQRFHIDDIHHEKPYPTATVRRLPIADSATRQARRFAELVRPSVLKYVELIAQASQSEMKLNSLPSQPKALALMVGIALQIENEEKQALLELPGIPEMLAREHHILSRELLLTQHMVDTQANIESMVFGPTGHAFPN